MKPLPWFKQNCREMDDARLGLLSYDDRWFYMALKMLKCQGQLDHWTDSERMYRGIARRLGVQTRELDEIARRISEVGLIDRESLQPINWEEEQAPPKPDATAAERKRRQRDRERAAQEAQGARVTKRSRKRSRVTVTDDTTLDKDADADLEKNSEETTTEQFDATFLGGFDLDVVVGILDEYGLKGSKRQAVADELVGSSRKGTIKTSWPGWLRSTAANASEADFKLNHGLAIKHERERRRQEEAEARLQRQAQREAAARRSDPASKAVADRAIAEMDAFLQ